MSNTKANDMSGHEMLNQSQRIDSSIETPTDPLPWLIHKLRARQADYTPQIPVPPTTEPPKDSP